MANPVAYKNGGRRFKKGEVHNPRGAGAHNKELKRIRQLSQEEVAQVGSFILGNNLEALKAVRADPTSSVFKVWVCSVAITAINKGDAQALNVLLDRIVGKVKEVSIVKMDAMVTAATQEQVDAAAKKAIVDC